MKAKRTRRILALLVGLPVMVIVVIRLLPANEPTYQGKSVSAWFEDYSRPSTQQGVRVVIVQRPGGRVLTRAGGFESLPDPAWDALRAIGSNAVPYLVGRLRVSPAESALYTRAFTNLPRWVSSRLPNPWKPRFDRQLAAQALGGLGNQASEAAPALLKALKESASDSFTRASIIHALRSIQVDQSSLNNVMLELGVEHRYAEVIAIAQQTGWQGDDMARLLGKILLSPDPAVRTNAMRSLEQSRAAAAPALDQIIIALKDPDREVRYLAARSIEAIGTNSPQVTAALQSALNDEHVMVRNVAQRILSKDVRN